MIAVLDYGVGNIGAVVNMFTRLGAHSEIVADARVLRRASGIVLPGNGSFDACMRSLRSSGLVETLEDMVLRNGTPVLGICVGAQMMGERSDEGTERGLGWLKMQVRRLPQESSLPVPHMGWQEVAVKNPGHWLSDCLYPDSRFYFVHSYYMAPQDKSAIVATAHYGIEFAAAVASGHMTGVQFHPEKSHRYGKAVLRAFAGGES